jgi:hypothetical protein
MKKLLALAITAVLFLSMFSFNVSAADLSIPKALTAPAIDGKINADEWKNALAIDVKQDSLNWVAKVNPSTGDSKMYFMWDANNIYFAADVKDTTVSSILPKFGEALNSGDGTQLAIYGIDATTNPAPQDGSELLFFSVHPKTDSGAPDVYEHFSIKSQIKEAKIASAFNGAAYTIECAIPFSTLATAKSNGFINEIKGIVGQKWKMDLIIMDADETGGQSLGTNAAWFDPTTSNTYTLADTGAGIDPASTAAETAAPAGTDTTAPATTTAAQTSDFAVISTKAVMLLCTAAVILLRKKK